MAVIEYVSGGGLAGEPLPASLLREGLAMRDALVADLVRRTRVATAVDHRLPAPPVPGVRAVRVGPGGLLAAALELAGSGRVWLIAPESGGRLAALAEELERAGARLAGPGGAAIRSAADKLALSRRLEEAGLPVPRTWPGARADEAVREAGFPLVAKPSPGAGCAGVGVAWGRRELAAALRAAEAAGGEPIVQELVRGTPASVALLAAAGGGALPLALAAQAISGRRSLSYRGGGVPLRHPLAPRALETARRACESLPGLRGWIGVDLVLAPDGPVVIEVNPRLTTSYVGLRRATRANLAGLALRAAEGELPPTAPALRGAVRFAAGGRVRPG